MELVFIILIVADQMMRALLTDRNMIIKLREEGRKVIMKVTAAHSTRASTWVIHTRILSTYL